MLIKLKVFLKKRKLLFKILRYCCIPFFLLRRLAFNISVLFRKKSKRNSYSILKDYKNIHEGKRCFIVCTGPSLTIDDLEKIKSEYTFGMNSLIKAYKETSFRATYYGIIDEYVYKNLEKEINETNFETFFCTKFIKRHCKTKKNFIPIPLDLLDHRMPNTKYDTKISDDAYLRVYSGFSINHALVQIAIYMGFKEIIFIGADCSYLGERKHFAEHNAIDTNADTAYYRFIKGYEALKNYAYENNISIKNATRGGYLELFDRVDLDKLIEGEK